MLVRRNPGWTIPEREVTPESSFFGRRAALAAGLAGTGLVLPPSRAGATGLPVAMRNPRYKAERAITPEREATTYNNYYEFGSHKTISAAAQKLPLRPWTVRVEGMVERPAEFGLDDLLRRLPIEERVYRHRCVEAWAMVVPWTGFQLSELLKLAGPLGSAKYVRFETAAVPAVMPGLRQSWYPWPYVEGCTIAEAANELSFMVVGAYGKPLPPQNGGPVRMHFPWKYGFKSGKSIVRIVLTDQKPVSFWEKIQPQEYGFWANVNPAVPHPRWSQATERMLGTDERVPTQLFNGYGEFVAGLYEGLQRERLWA
ncbi:protein-methionine-sulfoxide reductase catalytic subunit MsrP [Craurococcus roseus]|uniref:Protein-methionine-sulfoxide reductase catalytic subunit MsrP n=1 Tax=Craurococcus roseus TaxID=77585 RepID=A0ABN1G123_9PROT